MSKMGDASMNFDIPDEWIFSGWEDSNSWVWSPPTTSSTTRNYRWSSFISSNQSIVTSVAHLMLILLIPYKLSRNIWDDCAVNGSHHDYCCVSQYDSINKFLAGDIHYQEQATTIPEITHDNNGLFARMQTSMVNSKHIATSAPSVARLSFDKQGSARSFVTRSLYNKAKSA